MLVYSYKTVIALAHDLTQTSALSQRESTHNKKTFHIAGQKKEKKTRVLLKLVAYGAKLYIDNESEFVLYI